MKPHVAIALPPGSTDTAGTRTFLQERIGLWALWVFFLSGGFYVVSFVTRSMFGSPLARQGPLALMLQPGSVFHLAASLTFGAVWCLTRLRPMSLSALRALDTLTLMSGCTLFALMGLYLLRSQQAVGADGTIGLYAGLLACTNTVTARAIAVPSTAIRTLWLSTIAMLPLIAAMVLGTGRPLNIVNTATWSAVAIGVATVGSRVIFGLRTEADRVRRLGQYTLEEKIGEGGMGVVYRASHAMLRRPTAIKLLPPERAGDANLVRFEREVQMTAQLSHPNTIAIYDYGRTPEGVFYYAMEYLDGITLEELVRRYGPLPAGRVIAILDQVCGALAEAHGRGLVHRDIKPANIILTQRGGEPDVAKVVDFGLVKPLASDTSALTVSLSTVLTGTPLYMPPEAMNAPDVADPRSDLYALGAVGYFLLTGHPVFEGTTVFEVIGHHLHTEPVPPSQRTNNAVPADLEAVILRCLRKKPDDRPRDARTFRDALHRCTTAPRWTRDDAAAWWRTFRASGSPDALEPSAAVSEGLTMTVDVRERLSRL
jgi:eukaryotic-like serine/threonine-protein kinase